ncbi:MAG: exosortase/archaeosortase family protein [Candidatus Omnitrophica bacterium]|nr:exosortase/archaeosortase family protein [Candidatus Omnitrophota bacterium]
MNKKSLLQSILILLFILVLYIPVYSSLYERFTAENTYYSHGFLIPLVSLYLAWRKKRLLEALPARSSVLGLGVLLGGLLIYFLGLSFKVNFIAYLSIPLVIWGIILYLKGMAWARALFFPVAFLVFMLPLPQVFVIAIAFQMKLWAADMAAFFLRLAGLEVISSGSKISYPGGFLMVGDPCSGLRSLISFLALGALFSQLVRCAFPRKIVLLFSTVPIALLSNVARIMFLVVVSFFYGQEVALGFLHDASGVAVFVLGFIGLILVSKGLRCHLNLENT